MSLLAYSSLSILAIAVLYPGTLLTLLALYLHAHRDMPAPAGAV